jgi:hypothetical protein
MSTHRTYTLEDNVIGYVPEAPNPVICDHCEQMQNGHGRFWNSLHALRRSANHFHVLDYAGASTQECLCCHTRSFMGRHRVELIRKAA